ncbi:hypothetical protein, partial [Collinsella aerofaciens]|uniref:hypothetical protein n=1 Tax=Collinsella aerofaciens TaxID=74426 RepID=UPI00356AD5CB
VAEPDGVPQEAWIRLGAVQEIVRTPPALFRHKKSSDLLPKRFETVSKPQVEVLTSGKRSIYHRERCKNVLPYESTEAASSGVI